MRDTSIKNREVIHRGEEEKILQVAGSERTSKSFLTQDCSDPWQMPFSHQAAPPAECPGCWECCCHSGRTGGHTGWWPGTAHKAPALTQRAWQGPWATSEQDVGKVMGMGHLTQRYLYKKRLSFNLKPFKLLCNAHWRTKPPVCNSTYIAAAQRRSRALPAPSVSVGQQPLPMEI